MSSEEEENGEGIENNQHDEADPVFRSVAEADVSLDEMMSLACRQGKLDIVELLLESGAHVDYRNKAGNTPLLEACSQGHVDVARYLLDNQANIDAPTETTSDSALTWACTLGNEAIVELLLERKSNVEHRTKDGCTALMFAALAGHVKVAAMLLDYGAEINVESDSNKDSPLTFACWKGHCDVVELLLERSANIEHRTKEGFTPLMFAALGGHTDVAAKLLERGAKVNVPSGSNNDIPLTSACWKGHHNVVKLLLEFKSNIEHRTKDGCTPLMLAAREGHYSVAKLILDSNAEVNVPSGSENNIPLTLACWKGHSKVVELLLDNKSNIEHRNKAGCTPLMLAAREGHVETTQLLLSRGAEINKPSGSNDDTPLTLACWKGHVGVVELLLKHNSKVDHQTKTGCTPLMEATREGHLAVAELLLQYAADVELPDNYGQSPLFMACWKGHRDVGALLLEHSANRDCRTKTGITPLFQACRENHVDVVELLLDHGASVNAPFPNSRENPLTLGGEKGHTQLVNLLLSRNANVECHTKKGCTPFFLASREGHLDIAVSLLKKSADTEASDCRNNTPLIAAMKNGHVEVVEWLLNVTKHLPSEEQCQKCLVAPIEDKDRHEELMLGRTKCYDFVTKAKKAKEQKVQRNTELFLQELEHEKEREDIRKKKAAAKRRDKRKRRKAAKESEQQNSNSQEDLPLENRPQDVAQDDEPEVTENHVSECERTASNVPECPTKTSPMHGRGPRKDNPSTKQAVEVVSRDCVTDNTRNHQKAQIKLEHPPKTKKQQQKVADEEVERVLEHSEPLSPVKGEPEERSDVELTKSKDVKKKANHPPNHVKQQSDKPNTAESKKKTTSTVGHANPAEDSSRGSQHGQKQTSRKEKQSSPNTHQSKKTAQGKGQEGSTPSNSTNKNSAEKSSRTSSSDASQGVSSRYRDGPEPITAATGQPGSSPPVEECSRPIPKGSSSGAHSNGNRTGPSENEREHKQVHSPRSKQHIQVTKTEDNWKEVTRSTSAKTVVVQLTAPNALCGRVIGRGGSKINSITDESGAQITIGKPEPKNPGDRVITIKGSNKSVQRAKFLVTQALNTPSTMTQPTSTTSTATTVNATASDRADTSVSSGSPVRGNYAAIPSSSSASEWPTITQANNMTQQSQSVKSTSKGSRSIDEIKESPGPDDPSPVMDEVFEESSQALPEEGGMNVVEDNRGTHPKPLEKSPTNTTAPWSLSSAWKQSSSGPQTVAVCTSAETTSTSSSAQSLPTRVGAAGDGVTSNYPSSAGQGFPYKGDSQNSYQTVTSASGTHKSRTYEHTASIPVTTIAVSTSAAATFSHREQTLSTQSPVVSAPSSTGYGAIGSNKKWNPDIVVDDPSSGHFGVIGGMAMPSAAVNVQATPEFTSGRENSLLQGMPKSGAESHNKQNNFASYSPWAKQPTGISDVNGPDGFSSGGRKNQQGSLPGMELFTGSNSLFSGSLSSYPWSTGEDGDQMDRSRSISWSGQAEFQDSHYIPSGVPRQKVSPSGQTNAELGNDDGAFKPLSSKIWGPMSSQSHQASLSVVCDEDTHDKQAWNNSDSTSSSSRSSSRQELSLIMDSEGASNNGVWNSSTYVEELTPTPQQGVVALHSSLPDQGSHTGSQWATNRGAYSAPSSPSLPRTEGQPLSGPPSVVGQPSADDSVVSSWSSKQKSPRSHSNSEPSSEGWTENAPPPRRSSVDLSQSLSSDGGIPSHPWQELHRSQGYPPGLVMRENWQETGEIHSPAVDVAQLLQRLTLEKYLPVFEEHNVDGNFLLHIQEEDLEKLGIPKGPRLKILHAMRGARAHGMNSFHAQGNGFVKPEPPSNTPLSSKKPGKPQPQMLGSHNYSPSGLKKPSQKQNHILQQPGNPVSQPLLSVMPPGHGLTPSPHMGMMNHVQNSLPTRPHSASGGMSTQVYASVGSHGDQTLPYMAQQGQYVSHLPYSQPQPQPQPLPQPQVFYPGAYYFYYPQQ